MSESRFQIRKSHPISKNSSPVSLVQSPLSPLFLPPTPHNGKLSQQPSVTVVVAGGVQTAAQPVGQPNVGAFVTVGVASGQHLPAHPYVIVDVAGSKGQLQRIVVAGLGQAKSTLNRLTVTVGQAGSTMVWVILRSSVVVAVVIVLLGQLLGKAGDRVMIGWGLERTGLGRLVFGRRGWDVSWGLVDEHWGRGWVWGFDERKKEKKKIKALADFANDCLRDGDEIYLNPLAPIGRTRVRGWFDQKRETNWNG